MALGVLFNGLIGVISTRRVQNHAAAMAGAVSVSVTQVFAWSEKPAGGWERVLLHDFKMPVWRVSWSTTGNILAVSLVNPFV